MKKIYEGTIVVSKDAEIGLPAKGGIMTDLVEKQEKVMYRKIAPNYAEEIVTNIRFPLVSIIGNNIRTFYHNDSYINAKAAILTEGDNLVNREEVKKYIDHSVENYTVKYKQLKSLANQNQSIQQAIASEVKYGANFVKDYIQDGLKEIREKAKVKRSFSYNK